jgi:hypothetical protein
VTTYGEAFIPDKIINVSNSCINCIGKYDFPQKGEMIDVTWQRPCYDSIL